MGSPANGKGKPSRSVQIVEGRLALELTHDAPDLIGMIYHRASRGAARLSRDTLGLGTTEARGSGRLGARPGLAASRGCETTGRDKAAVSRALASLDTSGYLNFSAEESDPRRKIWRLSEKGHDLNDKVLDIAMARERLLITGISEDEVAAFNAIARRMLANLPLLDAVDAGAGGQKEKPTDFKREEVQ